MDEKMTEIRTVFPVLQTAHLRPLFDDVTMGIPMCSLWRILSIIINQLYQLLLLNTIRLPMTIRTSFHRCLRLEYFPGKLHLLFVLQILKFYWQSKISIMSISSFIWRNWQVEVQSKLCSMSYNKVTSLLGKKLTWKAMLHISFLPVLPQLSCGTTILKFC